MNGDVPRFSLLKRTTWIGNDHGPADAVTEVRVGEKATPGRGSSSGAGPLG